MSLYINKTFSKLLKSNKVKKHDYINKFITRFLVFF